MAEARRVLVIAGGDWQVPLVRKIKRMGHVVLSSNLYPASPTFALAEATLVADVRDKEANLSFARAQGADAVVTDQSDIAVPTVAYVCEQLGLPGIGHDAAELFTNKARMRAFCRDQGLPTPRFHLCRDLDEARHRSTDIGYPCVIKPPASQASRGVAKVLGADALEPAFAEAVRHSPDGMVLLEEFIGGVELTVEGIKNYERHVSLAVSRKSHYDHNPMVARRLFYGDDAEIDYRPLCAQHDAMVEAMGLPFGLTHAEYKYHHGKFFLVEIAARGGGTLISSDIVPLMSGVASNELLVRMALGEKPRLEIPVALQRFAALDFWDFAPGRVRAIVGLEAVCAMPDVLAAGLKIAPGDTIASVKDDAARHGYVIAWSDDHTRLEHRLAEIRQSIQILYDRD